MPDKLKAIMLQRKLNPQPNPFLEIKPEDMATLQRAWGDKIGLHDTNSEFIPTGEGDGLLVNHPPQFRPQPKVIGRPDTDRAVQQLLTAAPQLQNRIKSVQDVPGEDVAADLADDKKHWRPWDLERLSLLGLTDFKKGSITLNPRLHDESPTYLPQVLIHEATHATGFHDEDMPQYAESTLPHYANFRGQPPPTRDEVNKRMDKSDAMFDEIMKRVNAGQK